MYLINVRAHYEAAHGLRSYKGNPEPLHGHRWLIEVGLRTSELGEGGMAFDFVEVNDHLQAVIAPFAQANINAVPPFDRIEPSAENQARHFFEQLRARMPAGMAAALNYVCVWETPEQYAEYRE